MPQSADNPDSENYESHRGEFPVRYLQAARPVQDSRLQVIEKPLFTMSSPTVPFFIEFPAQRMRRLDQSAHLGEVLLTVRTALQMRLKFQPFGRG
jgi:hypothetical protein